MNECQEVPKCTFLYMVLFFFGPTLSGLVIILGRYQCVAASSDQLLR